MRKTAIAVFGLSFLVRIIGVVVPEAGYTDNPYLNPTKDSVIGRMDDFLVGMIAARIYAGSGRVRRPHLFIIGGLVVCTLAALFIDFTVLNQQWRPAIILGNSLFQIGAAFLVLGALSQGAFRLYALELMGLMCYSLYVWHGMLMGNVMPYRGRAEQAQFVLLLMAVSWLSYRYVEFGHVRNARELLPRRTALPG